MVSQAIGRELTWQQRRPGAAKHPGPGACRPACGCWPTCGRRCCLSTSNRSEAAVGYATMDGDTVGRPEPDRRHRQGVSCGAGCAGWKRRARRAPAPIPALAAVNVQAPTAELRPPSAGQTDEARPDALRAARRDRAGGHPRQADAAGSVPADAAAVSAVLGRSSWASGSSGSSASGAATNGSASATPRRSTSTTRTSIPRPGAVSRSSPAASSASWPSCGRTSNAAQYDRSWMANRVPSWQRRTSASDGSQISTGNSLRRLSKQLATMSGPGSARRMLAAKLALRRVFAIDAANEDGLAPALDGAAPISPYTSGSCSPESPTQINCRSRQSWRRSPRSRPASSSRPGRTPACWHFSSENCACEMCRPESRDRPRIRPAA